jgi:ATP-binding cassette subfamily B protein
MQLAGPLFNMGTFFREVDQSSVDIEDLYHMLKQQPIVQQKKDAKEFKFKEGAIAFEDMTFKHYILHDHSKKNKDKADNNEKDDLVEEK